MTNDMGNDDAVDSDIDWGPSMLTTVSENWPGEDKGEVGDQKR